MADFNLDFFKDSKIVGRMPNSRPLIKNKDGTVSTVLSDVVETPSINFGKPSLIPTIFDGKVRSTDEAIEILSRNAGIDPDTKEQVPAFNSVKEAQLAGIDKSRRAGEVVRMMAMRNLLKEILGVPRDMEF